MEVKFWDKYYWYCSVNDKIPLSFTSWNFTIHTTTLMEFIHPKFHSHPWYIYYIYMYICIYITLVLVKMYRKNIIYVYTTLYVSPYSHKFCLSLYHFCPLFPKSYLSVTSLSCKYTRTSMHNILIHGSYMCSLFTCPVNSMALWALVTQQTGLVCSTIFLYSTCTTKMCLLFLKYAWC